ncbi:hypothetical protein BH10BAC6_BH10BAC6_03860 [soil metagenome]
MKRTTCITLFLATVSITGCELFVVGGSKVKPQIERSQRSSVGVVYLFKSELDSGNVEAATELLAHASGRKLLAMEKYELKDEVRRLQRLMSSKEVTSTKTDTLSAVAHNVSVQIDYIRTMSFGTTRLNDSWFITKWPTIAAQ